MSFAPDDKAARECPRCHAAVSLPLLRTCPVCGASLLAPGDLGSALVEAMTGVLGGRKPTGQDR